MSANQELSEALTQLAINIKQNFHEYIDKKIIQITSQLYICSKVSNIDYSPQEEIVSHPTKIEYEKIEYKEKTLLRIEFTEIEKEYDAIFKILGSQEIHLHNIHSFIYQIANYFYKNKDLHLSYIEKIVNYFISDIQEIPINFTAYVKLEGIILADDNINFLINDINIEIRRPIPEDLEEETPFYLAINVGNIPKINVQPSGILTISYSETSPNKLQKSVRQAVTILRLFKVGSITDISYNIYSEEAILFPRSDFGSFYSTLNNWITKRSLFHGHEKSDIQAFWASMMEIMPRNFYDSSESTHLFTAYKHYSDALLYSINLTERIAKAVIGLEALILYENIEIAFRFKVRGAKILSFLGKSALEVREILKWAYDIRSLFVHGDDSQLEKKIKKLQHEYPDTNGFLIKLLDYLRIIIVVMIGLGQNQDFLEKNKKFDKKKFIALIDDALIDQNRENELNEILKQAVMKCHLNLNN